jgi:transcriptional regulator with PAS, ATPase and Fis domain
MIGEDPAMREVYRLVRQAAPLNSPVLILGETGTGKELVARALHNLSARARLPFVAVNAAAIAESIFESELFGHERGAFSDAKTSKQGLAEIAHGSTLYLDELDSLAPRLQAKLLRVIEDGVARRVGGTALRPAAPRWLASCQTTETAVSSCIRRDLWYRLAAVVLELPPLRMRRADISALVGHFMRLYGMDACCLDADVLTLLCSAPWPGNVRQLQHVVERLAMAGRTASITASVAEAILNTAPESRRSSQARESADQGWQVERARYLTVITKYGGDASSVAASLSVTRSTLFRRLRTLGLCLRWPHERAPVSPRLRSYPARETR